MPTYTTVADFLRALPAPHRPPLGLAVRRLETLHAGHREAPPFRTGYHAVVLVTAGAS